MALKLGRSDVGGLLRSLTLDEFRRWRAFAYLEPWDETRADYRAASIVWAIVNMNRDAKKHPTPYPLTDFLLKFGEAMEAQKPKGKTPAQLLAIARQITAAYNKAHDGPRRRRAGRG